MNIPQYGDYIDVHTHGSRSSEGIFIVENLMAHEGSDPVDAPGVAYSFGIHPWYLNEGNHKQLISSVNNIAANTNLIAIGEAGFDKLRGPSTDLQRKVFEAQVEIAEENNKPLFIHCVRAWDELLQSYKRVKPVMPWLVHGFRGSRELAAQLISKGMYISFWFDFVLRPESSELIKSLPSGRIFLETDGADVDIKDIYKKVANDLTLDLDDLKSRILLNYKDVFRPPNPAKRD
jgi:TatD DNase family protein